MFNLEEMELLVLPMYKKVVELRYTKTTAGDYIALAHFRGDLAMGVCRDKNLEYAKEQSVARLFKFAD